MQVATAQPLQPAVFAVLERLLEMPIEIVLAPRAAVGNLINRGYEQRQDLVLSLRQAWTVTTRRWHAGKARAGRSIPRRHSPSALASRHSGAIRKPRRHAPRKRTGTHSNPADGMLLFRRSSLVESCSRRPVIALAIGKIAAIRPISSPSSLATCRMLLP